MRRLQGLELGAQVLEATLRLPARLTGTVAPAEASGIRGGLRLSGGLSERLCSPLDFPTRLARAVTPTEMWIWFSDRCCFGVCCSIDGGNSHGGCDNDCGDLHSDSLVG